MLNNPAINNLALLVGRIMLAAIFIKFGFDKIGGYAGTQGYMEKFGVPGILLPLAILVELGGGLMIAIGYKTRLVALLIAGFTLITAIFFHREFGDRNQLIHFMKNISIAGGCLALMVAGAGAHSVDDRRGE